MATVTIAATAQEANQIDFCWTAESDHRARCGKRYVLRSPALAKGAASPLCADDRFAVCAYEGGHKWKATFWLGYDAVHFQAGTFRSAMNALEREINKRSLGLFGVDEVTFTAPIKN